MSTVNSQQSTVKDVKSSHDIPTDGGSDVATQLAEQAEHMRSRLASVRYVVAVMSGKGGVGKSTLAACLAAALATKRHRVGIVDGDINGPSIGRILGVDGVQSSSNPSGTQPALAHGGLRVMSISLFLAGEAVPVVWDAPTQENGFAWRGLREAGALRSLIADTAWGELDYLIVDLPPGSDRLANLADILPHLSGAIAITIPSAVSAAAVAKSVTFARRYLQTPILGLVENMAAHVCPDCGSTDHLFPDGSTDRLSEDLGVNVLARIPFDPLLAASADAGSSYVATYPNRPAAQAILSLADSMEAAIHRAHERTSS